MPRYRTNVRMQRREGVFEQPFFVWYGCICGVITNAVSKGVDYYFINF